MRYRARGQSLVEFALVVPILILFVMGIIDFSYYLFNYSQLENATRRTSEFVSKAANNDCIDEARTDATKSVFFLGANPFNNTNMSIEFSTSPPEVGGTVTVKLKDFGVQSLTPVGRRFFGSIKINFTSQRTILNTKPLYSGC